MPRTIQLSDTTRPIKEIVREKIQQLGRGEAIVMLELAQELGVEKQAVHQCIALRNRIMRRVPGYVRPVLLIINPDATEPAKSKPAKPRKPCRRK